MQAFDRRLTPARPDLAAAFLRGQVEALNFTAGQPWHVRDGLADVRQAPDFEASIDTQALHGENLTLYEEHEGWGWVQLARDGYVGYVSVQALAPGHGDPTHTVTVNRTFLYPAANLKTPPLAALPRQSALDIAAFEGDFARVKQGGFVFAAHLSAIGERAPDFVSAAEHYLQVAYLWGGKSCLGIDCSGLVQISLAAGGVAAPRDTDLQEKALGESLETGAALKGLQRGDLIFWQGHVGIMRNAEELLHANAFHMLVASEPLVQVRQRILAKAGREISSVRRLQVPGDF